MMRIIVVLAVLFSMQSASAAGGGEALEHAGANVHDLASVQRGAKLFMNYCHSCHSAKFMRYQRLAQDLQLPEDLVEQYLIFSDAKITDYMISAMPPESEQWFGKAPPDLSLVARSRGPDWIYSFLKGYYLSADGWNNTVLPNPAMPHVLWELQGIQRAVTETYTDEFGESHTRIKELVIDRPGRQSGEEYERTLRDLVAFLIYLGEPAILKRTRIGIWVILYLVIFSLFAYLLYQEYWRDVKK
ncbi:MAG: cytochrome c1 [Wenzhouxiangellaceae bacterium]